MLRGAATPAWSRRRRGGDQNLDPDGSTCSRDANERASESWFMVSAALGRSPLTTVKVAATTIRTCLRTEYLREDPMALSPADCWDHEGRCWSEKRRFGVALVRSNTGKIRVNLANNFRSPTGLGTATSDYSWSARMPPANVCGGLVGSIFFFKSSLT